jgi:predicted transcriptional regulator
MNMNGMDLKAKRRSAQIPGHILCRKAEITRTKLSEIECGYVIPDELEVSRISAALDDLVQAREKVAAAAKEAGWPIVAIP